MKKLKNYNALLFISILSAAAPAFSADEGGEDWSYPNATTSSSASKTAAAIALGGVSIAPDESVENSMVGAFAKYFVTTGLVSSPLKTTFDKRSTQYLSLLSSIQELETKLKEPKIGLIAKLSTINAESAFMEKLDHDIVVGTFKVKPGLKLGEIELTTLTKLNQLNAEALETRANLIRLVDEANGIQRAINADIEAGKIKLKFPEGSIDEHNMVKKEGIEHLNATKFKWLRKSGTLLSAISLGDLVSDVTNVLVQRKTPGVIPGSGLLRSAEGAYHNLSKSLGSHTPQATAEKGSDEEQ